MKTIDEFLLRDKTNRLHERCLRIVYSDSVLSFEDLLDKEVSQCMSKILRPLQ